MDNCNKLVSIVIPVYNRSNLINETIKSAINQTYKNIEIIIVDNKSTDDTFEVITKAASTHPQIKIFQNEQNIGPVKNWKKCIEYASGSYIKILWSDDMIHPEFIETCLPYFDDCNVGFVFTQALLFSSSEDLKSQKNLLFNLKISSGIYDSVKYVNGIYSNSTFSGIYPYSPGCAMFNADAVKKNLLIDIPNRFGIDFAKEAIGNDLLIFLLTAADFCKFAYVDKPYAYFRKHDGSISSISSGKLALVYTISKCIFLEKDLIVISRSVVKRFNSIIKLLLKENFANQFKINSVADISSYESFGYDYLYLLRKQFGRWANVLKTK